MRDSDRSIRKWWYLPAISMATIGTVAIAVGAVPHSFNTGDTLTAADLNANFAALESRLAATESKLAAAESRLAAVETGPAIRTIARAYGVGSNDGTDNGAIASRHLQYTKIQAATGLRIVWSDNLRCTGAGIVSCEWELKIDGASCPTPGPMKFDMYSDTGAGNNSHRPQAIAATCFGISAGPHTVQVYVTGSAPAGSAGDAYTGWGPVGYWSLEVEEVL